MSKQDVDVPATSSRERAFVSVSLTFLGVFYGFCAATLGWFPAPLFERALSQASTLFAPPHFAKPRVYQRQGARTIEPEKVQPGLTLLVSVWEDLGWRPGLKLMDIDGRVLHTWAIHPEDIFPALRNTRNPAALPFVHGVHLYSNGDVVANVEYVGTVRLDACGNVAWVVQEGNHHSISVGDDGSLWIPATQPASEPPTSEIYPDGYPGLNRAVAHDHIMQISPDGQILNAISVLDILYENGLQRYLAKGKESVGNDLIHLNDVAPLPRGMVDEYPLFEAGDLLVSIRNSDLVAVVDPETLTVRWHTSEPFIQQHDPVFVGDGWIGVFDNNSDWTLRGELTGGSRIIALQPHTDSTMVLFPTAESDPFYTRLMGKWQQLANGNLLLTEAQAGRVVEVEPGGRTVWEWIAEPYDARLVAEVSEGSRYDLTPDQVAAWPCSPSAAGRTRTEPET